MPTHDLPTRLGHHHPYLEPEGPLAYYIRLARGEYGDHGISQVALAKIAGVSPSFLRHAEHCHSVHLNFKTMLRVSLALGVPLEKLIRPELFSRLKDEVEKRRRAVEKGATAPDDCQP